MRSYNKTDICSIIAKELNNKIRILHVGSVISILIEELIKELKDGKEIKINNFGTFLLKEKKPTKVRSIHTGQIKFARKSKALRFKLVQKLSKYILEKLTE